MSVVQEHRIAVAEAEHELVQAEHELVEEEVAAIGITIMAVSTAVGCIVSDRERILGRGPYLTLPRFAWEGDPAASFFRRFRFGKSEFLRLFAALRLPSVWISEHGDRCTGQEALLMVLYRLHRPVTLFDMKELFGRGEGAISAVINEVMKWVVDRYKIVLNWDCHRLVPRLLQQFADAVFEEVRDIAPGMNDVIGFIDGTLQVCARPKGSKEQEVLFSGHKRRHGLKFQAITTPDGVIVHLGGPVAGRRHDMTIYGQCRTAALLRQHAPGFRVYGDKGYRNSAPLCAPEKGADLPADLQRQNAALGQLRVSVEWSFGQVKNLWRSQYMAPELKPHQQQVAAFYQSAVLFTNCYTCLYGNVVGRRFGLVAPSLEEYLHYR